MHKKSTYRVLALLLALGMLFSMLNTTAVQASDTEPQASITVAPEVLTEMETKGSASYWIEFSAQPDLSAAYQMSWSERGWYVYDTLSKAAKTSQARVAAYLENSKVEYQSYWIKNTILVESSNKATLNGLMSFSEIKAISPRQTFILYEPDKSAAILDNGTKAIEPNLTHINADDVWAMGIDGAGMVIANIDTGVRFSHQALVGQYRGNLGGGSFNHNYNWFNPDDHSDNVPRDGNGHGTHTMGTMVGDDGGSNQIGIAPGAKWIACAGCPDGGCTDSALLGCGQFIAAPTDLNGANANPDKRPNAVNNSWGDCGQTYDNWFEGVISAWHAGGVYPIFSNGNSSNCEYSSPPGLNTVGNPARSGNVTGVGSSGEQNGQYASHSNWGPTDNADTVNPTDGFIYMKPQVLAPGVSIRSSTPGSDTEYQDGWSGTSMSAPHVTGLVALIWQAAPCLVGDYAVTENVIEQTAVHLTYNDGSPDTPTDYPNYATGWGEIDALAAVNYASGLCVMGTLQGTVTSDGTTPVAGVKVHADNGAGFARIATTAADGTYSVDLTEGTYTVTASKYGNDTVSVTGVVITEGATTTQDFVLAELGTSHVSGVVYDDGVTGVGLHGYPLYASIHITAEGFDDTIFTDPFTGQYGVELIQDTPHTFTVTPIIPGYTAKVETVTPISYATSQDFPMKVSETCSAPGYLGSGVNEGFESGMLPPGWENFDYAGSGQVWLFDDPDGRGNLTPGSNGGFAVLDSDYYGNGGNQDAGLRTPVMDFSGESSVALDFDTNYNYYSGDRATVRVSSDNGATWTDVWMKADDFVDHVHLDISAQAAGKTGVIIEFRYTGSWAWWWQVDDVLITPLNCGLKDGGVVAGFVYDDNDNNPLIGADVSSADVTTKTFSVADDPNNQGLYWVFQPSSVDPEDVEFTASMALYGSQTKTVSVKQDQITQQDFYLGSGELEFDPGSFEVTMQMGDPVHTETLTIENYGSASAMYELVEKDAGFEPPLSIPAFTDALPEDSRTISMGKAPEAAKGVGLEKSSNGVADILAGAPAFAIDIYPGYNLVNIPDTDVPGVWNIVGSVGTYDFFAGDFVGGDFDTLYAVEYNTNGLYAINTATAAATLIGPTAPPSGQTFSGLTGAPDGTMYGLATSCSASSLVIVDITSGATTVLGDLPGVDCGIDLAYNPADDMIYIVDLISTNLMKVDPATLTVTTVGSLGVTPNYAQGMDFEEESGVLYWAAYVSSGELRVIDTTTGASALVGAFPSGAETDCLAFPTGGVSDVPWLSEDPASGTVDAFGDKEVTISFDPTGAGLSQPGDYLAELKIKHNTPYTHPNIPVTLHLIAPSTYGTVKGTVSGLKVCDVDPTPLKDAVVNFWQGGSIVYTTSNAAGYYSYAVPAGTYDLEVVAAGYLTAIVEDVEVLGGSTLTQNFDLRLLAPCMSVLPTELEQTQPADVTTSQTLTIINTGAWEGSFELMEIDGGYQPWAGTHIGKTPSLKYSPEKDLPGLDKSKNIPAGVQAPSGGSNHLLDVLIDEGFENAFPPTGWAQVINNPSYTWEKTSDYFYEGSYGALVPWDYNQDEWLLTPEFALSEGTLSLYSIGSIYWCRDTYDNCDLNVWLVVGDVGGGDDIFVKNLEEDWTASWTWEQSSIDLAAFLPGGPVRIGIQMIGDDDADIAIDAVVLDGVEGLDVPWLSEDPVAGTVPADGSLAVTITYDSTGLAVGDYLATLRVKNPPAAAINIPVTLHVTSMQYFYIPLLFK